MRKFLYLFLTAIILTNIVSEVAYAQPTDEEIQKVLQEKGLTMEKLLDMLKYYEYRVEDFQSAEELSDFIGTPITSENLTILLNEYELTRSELDALLKEYDLAVEDHFAIEELKDTVDFVINHDKEMKELEEFLTLIGISELETNRLFKHFEALNHLELKDKMEQIGSRLEMLMTYDPEAKLSKAQMTEVISVWNDMMKLLNVRAEFSIVDESGNKKQVSFEQLTEGGFNSNELYIGLYTPDNQLLLDMQVASDLLTSDFAISAGEKLTDIGDSAGELTKIKHSLLPNTASAYGLNILLGLLLLLAGFVMLWKQAKGINKELP